MEEGGPEHAMYCNNKKYYILGETDFPRIERFCYEILLLLGRSTNLSSTLQTNKNKRTTQRVCVEWFKERWDADGNSN